MSIVTSFSRNFSYLIILIALSAPAVLFGQQTGKLSGKVTDAVTGEALIGVNITLEGTTLGATSDVNGRFVVLKIPPGEYIVHATLVGYAKYTVKEVEINIDRTTELNIKLRDATVEMEQVVVVAEKPKIIKDQTSTSSTLNETQIKAAPIEGLRGALDLTAGFQKTATGNYQVRGSGSYEINFQINGIEQVNTSTNTPAATPGSEKANNSWKYDVNPLGVQQVQLITGGFSAEYGNAQAGVVKVVLKEGTPRLNGEVRFEYRPEGQYHFGRYVYDQNNYEWQKWGNINNWYSFKNDESFIRELGLLDKVGTKDRYNWLYTKIKGGTATAADSMQWNDVLNREISWAYNLWVKNHSPAEDNPLGVYDYRKRSYNRILMGFGGPLGKDPGVSRFYFSGEYRQNPTRLPTPEKDQIYQNYILNLTFNPFKDHKVKIIGSFQKYVGGIWSGSDDIRWAGLPFVPSNSSQQYLITVDPVRTEQTISQSLNWVYTIDNSSFFETTVSHQNEVYTLPYLFLAGNTQENDRLDSLYDPAGLVLRDGRWWESSLFRRPFNLSTNYYQDSRNNHWSVSADYTNQILKTNLLKAGARFYYWDLFNNAVNSSYQANTYVSRSGYAEYYHAYPLSAAFYIQDKMEYEGMIANFGLRAEAYNFQSNYAADRFNVFYQGNSGPGKPDDPYGDLGTVASKTQFIIMPRVGLSFPIGEATAFRIQYGHFASMPIFSQGLSQRTDQGWLVLGNPNLDYKKTINYEFGLQQIIEENHRLDVAFYYNDRVTQIGTQRYASFTGSKGPQGGIVGYTEDNIPLYPYTTYSNNSFGTTIGIDITFEKLNAVNWSYRLSYSLSQTTEGNYGSDIIYPTVSRNASKGFTGEFLGTYDRTHSFRGLLQYIVREGEGLRLFGIPLFASSVFGLSYTAQTGLPFTYTTVFDPTGVRNNRRYPLESVFDFTFQKEIRWSTQKLLLGIRVMNLFNNKWLTPVGDTDLNFWVEKGITMDNPLDKTETQLTSYRTAAFKVYKNTPQQIFFTIGYGF